MEKSGNIFLIGFMGTGKSTVSEKLHQMMQMELVDMDERIVQREGMPISQIFEKSGETYFRDVETQVLVELKNEGNTVVSCGGGVVVRSENIRHMKENGKIVLLTATPETVYERVRYSGSRPILNGHMNVEHIKELMQKRQALYEEAADVIIATDGKDIATICKEIIGSVL
jgi:shikimate kinase